MALLTCHFSSATLGMGTTISVVLPQPTEAAERAARVTYPALYLLHGWSDDETAWIRRTSIERYAMEKGIAVIMPRVDLTYYQDTADGRRYWSYVSEELPRVCEQWFPLRTERECRWAAGLSMGGYGAFRLGLQRPDKFSHVASLSGALDLESLVQLWRSSPIRMPIMTGIFGDLAGLSHCEGNLLRHIASNPPPPVKFYQWCGTEDFLLEANRHFYSVADAAGLDIVYSESPGDHSWQHWDREIQGVLQWLPNAN